MLFVVQGTGGSYADTGDGTATLTLTGVNGQATWFNDRPQRQAGTAAVPAALEMIGFSKDPPNAVMTVSLADPTHDALALKLENPSYDQANAALTFTATPLKKPAGAGLAVYRPQLDDSVNTSFGEFSLFVDDTNTRVTPGGAPASPFDFELRVNVGSRRSPAQGKESIDIIPLWDSWNQCIIEGTPTRVTDHDVGFVPVTGGELPTHITISAERNVSGSCITDQSRMHWMLKRRGGKGAEEIRALGGVGSPVAECVDVEAGLNVVCGGTDVNVELL